MARALGDFFYGAAVPAKSEMSFVDLTNDDFALVIGSDGLFDEMSNVTVCETVRSKLDTDRKVGRIRSIFVCFSTDYLLV